MTSPLIASPPTGSCQPSKTPRTAIPFRAPPYKVHKAGPTRGGHAADPKKRVPLARRPATAQGWTKPSSALRRELTACLRTGRALRVPRARTRGRGKQFASPEVMISQRPAEADDRAVPGHWEGDLILGLGSSAIGTLVERTTRSRCCCTCAYGGTQPWGPGQERPGVGRPWRRGRPGRHRLVDHDPARAAPQVADLGSGR